MFLFLKDDQPTNPSQPNLVNKEEELRNVPNSTSLQGVKLPSTQNQSSQIQQTQSQLLQAQLQGRHNDIIEL